MQNLFAELGIVLLIGTILAMLLRYLKQPTILAYIITGILAGPLGFNLIHSTETFETFSNIGIAFLLFIVGLSLNVNLLREVGSVALYTGVGQVVFTALIGYYIVAALGFPLMDAMFISIAMTFSSTVIIVKLLSDKQDIETLYGKISLGFLLVQDFVAIMLIILLTGGSLTATGFSISVATTLIKGAILFAAAIIFTKLVVNKVIESISRTPEILLLGAISWCFLLAMLASWFGFSMEIGAFLAGVSIASLPYNAEIASRVKPLRDFFLVIFFVVMGSQMIFESPTSLLPSIIWLSLFVLIGNPLIVMAIVGILGFTKRTGFLVGLNTAQLSEFSLILGNLGLAVGYISQESVTTITAVAVITIALSSYLITYNEKLFSFFSPYLDIFERKKVYETKLQLHRDKRMRYDIILLGHHRVGYSMMRKLRLKNAKFLVLDYNPAIIERLIKRKVPCIYGDISDPDIIDQIKHFKPKVIISTIHLYEDNVLVTKIFKSSGRPITVIATANTIKKALDLYSYGADYVIVPHVLAGEHFADLIKDMLKNKRLLTRMREKHINQLSKVDLPLT